MSEGAEKPRRRYVRTGLYIRTLNGLKARDRHTTHLANRILSWCPWLTDADRPAVRIWAQLEYLGEQVFLELKEHGVFTKDRELRRLAHDFRQLRIAQLAYSVQLGMVPAARAGFKPELSGELVDLTSIRDDGER